MLVRLLYASRGNVADDPEALQTIVRQSRANNPRLGLTGLLCCADGVFIQVLEGGRDEVNRMYGRIAADARHTDVVLLIYEEIDERRFAGWAMGQVDMARLNPALLLKYSPQPRLDPYALSGKASMALFEELLATGAIVADRP